MKKNDISKMRSYLLLWFTQMISGLGSAMTGYALVIWSYTQQGSALATALLMVCSYAPYVICSIFAGALSDRWDKKKTMLSWHAMAAFCTAAVLFLAAINLVASMYDAAFPAMMLSKPEAGQRTMGIVNGFIGITTLAGSILASLLKAPKSRVRAIWGCLMLSMCTENFFLAFGNVVYIWCFGAFLGWIGIPWMNANLDVINRLNIPVEMQGRVFAARNSFQFFTIPVGYFAGGLLVDQVFEPFLASRSGGSLFVRCFGSGKGSGAAFLFAVLWLMGIGVCLLFRGDRAIWELEK